MLGGCRGDLEPFTALRPEDVLPRQRVAPEQRWAGGARVVVDAALERPRMEIGRGVEIDDPWCAIGRADVRGTEEKVLRTKSVDVRLVGTDCVAVSVDDGGAGVEEGSWRCGSLQRQ